MKSFCCRFAGTCCSFALDQNKPAPCTNFPVRTKTSWTQSLSLEFQPRSQPHSCSSNRSRDDFDDNNDSVTLAKPLAARSSNLQTGGAPVAKGHLKSLKGISTVYLQGSALREGSTQGMNSGYAINLPYWVFLFIIFLAASQIGAKPLCHLSRLIACRRGF